MTREEALQAWKNEYAAFLNSVGIGSLRSLGRYVGVAQATAQKKSDLVGRILEIAAGESAPAEKSRRGAPVKEDFVDPALLTRLDELNFRRASIEAEFAAEETEDHSGILPEQPLAPGTVQVRTSGASREPYFQRTMYGGELTMRGGAYCINIVEPKERLGDKAAVSSQKINESGARTGDRITFHADDRLGFLAVTKVLSVNAVTPGEILAGFDRAEAEYPCEKLLPFDGADGAVLKYFCALYPVGRGQRVLVSGVPKSGKSTLLRAIAASLIRNVPEVKTVVGLCERAPESIGEWQRRLPTAEIYASGYCDDAEEHLAQAEKALERAKEYVCEGTSAVLLVDSLNSLARAFNETERSLGGRTLDGGLESKTVHYMKKFLGAARKLKVGASLTVFGVLSVDTGSPFDAALARELLSVSSATWQLAANFRHGKEAFPDFAASHVDYEEKFLSEEECRVLAGLFAAGAERVFEDEREDALNESRSEREFLSRIL